MKIVIITKLYSCALNLLKKLDNVAAAYGCKRHIYIYATSSSATAYGCKRHIYATSNSATDLTAITNCSHV